MENELVKDTKTICLNVYEALKAKHAEKKGRGASVKILNEMVDDMDKAIEIYNSVNEKNVEKLHADAIDLETTTNFKYMMEEKEVPSIDEDDDHEDDNTEEDEEEEDEKKSGALGVVAGLVGVTLLAGSAVHTGLMLKNAKAQSEEKTETVEETETAVRVLTTETEKEEETKTTTTEETKSEEETKTESTEETKTETETTEETKSEETVSTERQLVLGEYGTFFDVTNDEQVEARAQYIIDTYYAPIMNQLTEEEKSIITQENIANIIRVFAGELPVDANGNKIMNGNVVDDYGQKFIVLLGDLGSSPQLGGRLVNVPAHLFTPDGTALSEFAKVYDGYYQEIADGRNQAADQRLAGEEVTGGKLVRTGIENIGHDFWYQWVMQGIFGDVNPYNFEAKDRLFAYFSAFAKYGQFAYEYNLDSMQAVCIPVCVNYETKEMNELPVNEIFVGYASGIWDTVIAKTAGIPAQGEPDSIAFTQDLMDELTWKYNNIYQHKLN